MGYVPRGIRVPTTLPRRREVAGWRLTDLFVGVQVTILCEDAAVGDTGVVDGVTYTKVDRAGLDVLAGDKSKWPMLATSCTSGVNDTSRLFRYKGDEYDLSDEFDVDISSWDTSSVTNMEDMFRVRALPSRLSLLR